jgi:hypothetical protein
MNSKKALRTRFVVRAVLAMGLIFALTPPSFGARRQWRSRHGARPQYTRHHDRTASNCESTSIVLTNRDDFRC